MIELDFENADQNALGPALFCYRIVRRMFSPTYESESEIVSAT